MVALGATLALGLLLALAQAWVIWRQLSVPGPAAAVLLGTLAADSALALLLGGLLARRLRRDLRAFHQILHALSDLPVEARPQTMPSVVAEAADIAEDCQAFARSARTCQAELYEVNRELRTALSTIEAAQAQLIEQERLAALGRLAAGIAHELRNPLSVLSMRLDLIASGLRWKKTVEVWWLRQHLDHLQDATARALRIMSSLSMYSKPPRPEFRRVAVSSLLEDTHELIAYQARTRRVTVAVESEPRLSVNGDRGQLLEVLINLATNAIEATDGGGVLTLRARGEGGKVVLDVADTGGGIPPEIEARIWEPFFTTKSEGTGLGLHIVRQIIEAHGGEVGLSSRPGKGTTFLVSLPALVDPVREAPLAPASQAS